MSLFILGSEDVICLVVPGETATSLRILVKYLMEDNDKREVAKDLCKISKDFQSVPS